MTKTSLKILVSAAIFACTACVAAAQAPIEIRTAEDMAAIGKDENSTKGSYILMNDLTLDNWIPAGNIGSGKEHGFSGTFDGNGYTVTITGFHDSSAYTKLGLFGSIDKEGRVKNLCITGNISYAGNRKFLYMGGIAGINYGHIACCVSKIVIEGNIIAAVKKPSEKVKGLFGYEDGVYGGGIAGINLGSITNCYSAGSVLVYGDRMAMHAGGIAGGNGQPVGGSIGISIGSGGGGISVSQGTVKSFNVISYCYSVASIFSSGTIIAASGGIAGFNHPSGLISKCVALNKTIEANATTRSAATPVASIPFSYYRNPDVYYSEDIAIREYKNRQEKKPDNFSKKNAVAFSATQEQSWWTYPDGLTEKQRNTKFGFYFGEDEQSPWVWNDRLNRPVMYWEKNGMYESPEPPVSSILELLELDANSIKTENSDIKWTIENNTLTVSGWGDISGAKWGDISAVTSVITGDSITSIGHHTFTMSKISTFVLGSAITKIGSYAFFNCNNLVQMELKSRTPPEVGSFAFMSTPIKKAKLIVPAGTKAVYENSKDWKKFGTIEERE
ncbi:MAG: leucine-rich repeat domain-containing protein [Prevotellaceae bacterium]|jgi:hypothetical protein|nr:leucine-rich repeat domain-containing protein [Prevotellaceae bacterium]